MSHRTDRRTFALLALTVALAGAGGGGCASSSQGERMVQSFGRTQKTLIESRGQVVQTADALKSLRLFQGETLKNGFRHYKESVAALEKAGSEAKDRATAMREESEAHIKAWQEEMETVKDPGIKSTLQSRREAVRTNFKLLQMYAEDARKAYGPYLQGNKDIVQALSIDLSPVAVSSLSSSIDKVLAAGQALDQKLWMMQRALDNIANGVSPLPGVK